MTGSGEKSLGTPLLNGKEALFDGREPETLISDFLPAPEPFSGPLQTLLYGAATVGLTLALLVPVCAFLLIPLSIFALFRHVQNRWNAKWRRDPKDLRVAIIGGGWTGVQAMQRFRDYGCEQVKGFDRNSTLGGTFGKDQRYAGLQVHSPLVVCTFLHYPFERISERGGKIMDGKARGDRLQHYIESFCSSCGLEDKWRLGAKVTSVKYDSSTKEARITVRDVATGLETEEGPFDFVLFTGWSSKPNLPKLPNEDAFRGEVIHSVQCSDAKMQDILTAQKKVVIVGSSKSACDHCLVFFRAGYRNFDWVYRRTTLFWKYEFVLPTSSLLNRLRGLTTIVALLWCAVSSKVGSLIWWCNSLHCTVDGVMHLETDSFHFGVLCPTQRAHMRQIMPQHGKRGNPARYSATGLQLEHGDTVDADVVIWATGFNTAVEDLVLEKDGVVVDIPAEQSLYHHMIPPQFPCMGHAGVFFTTFGPLRGCNVAEYALHYCCVQNMVSEEQMQRSASWNLSKVSWGRNVLNVDFTVTAWIYMHTDLILRGVEPVFALLWHLIVIFMRAYQGHIELGLLPPLPGDIRKEQ